MSQSQALTNRQIASAAAVVLVGFLASGLLGLVRTAVIAATFGTGVASDAFLAAQRIPELIFVLVAGGALGSSFLPVFTRYLRADNQPGAWRLASAVITLSALAAALLSLLVAVFAPQIVEVVLTPGKPPEVQALTVSLMQIMMLTPFIFSISGLVMGILQAHGSFLLPSLAISMNNVGLILGALLLAYIVPAQPDSPAQVGGANVYGLAWGAVLSAGFHLLIQLPSLFRIQNYNSQVDQDSKSPLHVMGRGFRGGDTAKLRFLPDWRIPGVREVLALMGPRVLGLGVAQINFLVNANFASLMIAGSYTALVNAWTLMFFALGIIGQSVGTAVFPSLASLAAENDLAGFKDRLASALRGVLFLAIPSTAGLILLGRPLVALLYQRGEFTPESTSATAWALAFYALGIAGHAGLEVLSRAFYALSDTRTPVVVGLVSMLSNITLSVIFIRFIGDPASLERGPFAGLALANSITTLLEALALWWLLRRRIGSLNDGYVWNGLWRTLVASLAMAGTLYALIVLAAGRLSASLLAVVGILLGAALFLGMSVALRMDEPRMVLAAVLRRVGRSE